MYRHKIRKGARVFLKDDKNLPVELKGKTATVLKREKDFVHVGFPQTSWPPPHYTFIEPLNNITLIQG